MKKASIRDWLASRTVRLNAVFLAVWSAVLPIVIMWDESDWQEFGLSKSSAMLIVVLVNAIGNISNIYMRGITKKPIAGRSEE